MPRIGATLAAFALIACSIAVNISRYPVVWEMAAPTAQLPSSPQVAQSEPAEDRGDAPDSENATPIRSYAVAERDAPTCSADGAYCYREPSDYEPSDSAWGEYSVEAPAPHDDRPMVSAEIAARKPEKTGPGKAPKSKREKPAHAEPDPYRDGDSFAYNPKAAPDEAAAGFADDFEAAAAEEPDSWSGSRSVSPEDDADTGYAYDGGFAGAEEIEPEGPYAGSASTADAEYSGKFSMSPGGYAADDQPETAASPAAESERRLVPVVPQATPDAGSEMAATIGAPFGFRSEVRRLPPIDEINPFLNDGYDPPTPDISGMNYPNTGVR